MTSLAIGPDGIHPVSTHSDGKVRVWDISPTGSHEMWAIYPAFRASFSRDGKQLATLFSSGYTETTFQLWAISPQGVTETHTIKVDSGSLVSAYGFSADLSRFATVDINMMLNIWDPTSGQLLQSFSIGQTAASTGYTNIVRRLAFSPDGAHLATGSDDGTAIVWDLASSKPLLTLTGHQGPVYGINFSPDGTLLATPSADGTARIWDAATGDLLQTMSGHAGGIYEAQFSPDGKRLVTTSADMTAKVWDVQTGKELLTLKGNVSSVFWADFSPDGTHIITGSADGTTIVWDASTGQAMLTLSGFYVRFAPDGKSVMTLSPKDMVARGFYLDIGELITLAHSRVTRSLTTDECQKYLHVDACPAEP